MSTKMKSAVMYDECGSDFVVSVPETTTADQIREDYPECRFRYFEDPEERRRQIEERVIREMDDGIYYDEEDY